MRPTTPFRLPDCHAIALDGRDALAFAQAQCMNDVGALADSQWQWNGWLTPKGRVIALFALARLDAEHLRLLLLDHPAEAFITALRRYVFRSKVTITALDGACNGAFAAASPAEGNRLHASADGRLFFDFGTAEQPRSVCIDRTAAPSDPDALMQWRADDLRYGLPRLEAVQRERWTPQQLSLDRLRAYSVKKGCYPGQEIVARTHFLGQAKRGLVLLEGAATLDVGSAVTTEEGTALGELIAAAGNTALAVLPLDGDLGTLHSEGQPVQSRALLDGLTR